MKRKDKRHKTRHQPDNFDGLCLFLVNKEEQHDAQEWEVGDERDDSSGNRFYHGRFYRIKIQVTTKRIPPTKMIA